MVRGGGEGRLWAVSLAGMQGAELPLAGMGGKAPTRWSINAFCVVVKPFS